MNYEFKQVKKTVTGIVLIGTDCFKAFVENNSVNTQRPKLDIYFEVEIAFDCDFTETPEYIDTPHGVDEYVGNVIDITKYNRVAMRQTTHISNGKYSQAVEGLWVELDPKCIDLEMERTIIAEISEIVENGGGDEFPVIQQAIIRIYEPEKIAA